MDFLNGLSIGIQWNKGGLLQGKLSNKMGDFPLATID
jgi:hypothetical protein